MKTASKNWNWFTGKAPLKSKCHLQVIPLWHLGYYWLQFLSWKDFVVVCKAKNYCPYPVNSHSCHSGTKVIYSQEYMRISGYSFVFLFLNIVQVEWLEFQTYLIANMISFSLFPPTPHMCECRYMSVCLSVFQLTQLYTHTL